MARIDKSDPNVGSFRAPLAAAYTGASAPLGVGLDVNGRVVAGAGANGKIVGVICIPEDKPAATVIDVLKLGELVEFAGAAGTEYSTNTTTGVIDDTAVSATQIYVGHTVEATRLILNVGGS